MFYGQMYYTYTYTIVMCLCMYIEDFTVHMLMLGYQHLLLLHLESLIGVFLSVDWVINVACWSTPAECSVVYCMKRMYLHIHWVLDNAWQVFDTNLSLICHKVGVLVC